MRVLGLVPARGGSKGVPRKNVRPLGGRPLLHWTAEAALAATRLSRVVLTTDDPEIAEVGGAGGLEVPFLRPAELARDETPTLPVVQHALRMLEAAGDRFDAVCLLQPTSPFRTPQDIDACVALLAAGDADAVVTVLRVPAEHNPHWVYFRGGDGALRLATGEAEPIPRRQALPPAFHRDGSVYVTRRDVVLDGHSLYGGRVLGYETDAARSVNVDDLDDWARAEAMLAAFRRPAATLEAV
jgi:CMP-N,N'-diacetyllegionaminic acid synthase